ncbi:MAG TPA: TM0106 family RecB-like putative nuclease [Geminicoccaceae bacterium]|nr:TM0106 family RecB-like putative nuclease [Geminicoccaceae bacterium]
MLQERGLALEQLYLDRLRAQGLAIVDVGEGGARVERTVGAMRAGAAVIYQATLRSDRWHGRADFLRRVERPSRLGGWSYEVLDAKLARETRAGTILQLCLYSHMVGEIQGRLPEQMHVVTPGEPLRCEPYRVADFLAYHRLVQRRLVAAAGEGGSSRSYPDPVPQCDVCRWWQACDRRRRDDDHLCLVAGISKLQIGELGRWGVGTLAGLAALPLPLQRRPSRGAPETYERIREQARLQYQARRAGRPLHEVLLVGEGQGLCSLPEPSQGDVFLDFEGDPFVRTGGLEYLLGWSAGLPERPEYRGSWAFDPAAERAMFEAFIDFVTERWRQFPGLHIYHFAPYEPAALKRLMGRYATRENELDRLLRAERFVDLHAVVRQAVRASVERYSLKDLEVLYQFERVIPLGEAGLHRRAFERALELGAPQAVPDEIRSAVEAYNRDDCLSTMRLRDWLEALRRSLVDAGQAIPRPQLQQGDPSDAVDERQQRVQELYERLAGDVPPDPNGRHPEQQARWLLANLLDWHRREKKASWWEYFRLLGLGEEELLEERAALAGLEFADRVATPKKSVVDRYTFPPQECEIREGDGLRDRDGRRFAKVEAIDVATRWIEIRKGPSVAAEHRSALFRHDDIDDKVKREALMRLGQWVAAHGIDAPGAFRAGRDLLLRRPPRPGAGIAAGEDALGAARGWVEALDHSVLPIQGPPGAGKTYTGARMITSLVRAGRKVGVTALSHKVIRNLLDEVVKAAEAEHTPLRCVQKVGDPSEEPHDSIAEINDNGAILDELQSGAAQVAAGTAWLWAREEFFEAVDVLFVDEAGQLTLADVLAVSQAAKSLVLLGDPQQLGQPLQGSHPEGTDVSALQHILAEHQTMPAARGLFLDHTWRLHPRICDFTSELFYEGRLAARPNLDRRVLDGPTPFAGAGLWFVPVPHEGNQSSSPEEVERVAELVAGLTAGGVHWTDERNDRRPLQLSDILIIAPYNAQVAALKARLPAARVGTVDKFQGQEAAVVVCSLTTSSLEEAPRGMEFLYSPNRLNVAVSRAKTACVLVGSPALFEPECRSPAQMRLANAFCRYLELAQTL